MSQGNIHFCILSMFGLHCSVLTVKNRLVLLTETRFLKGVCVCSEFTLNFLPMTPSGYDTRFVTKPPAMECHDNGRLSRLTYTRINNKAKVIATKETEKTAFQSFGFDSGNENLSFIRINP